MPRLRLAAFLLLAALLGPAASARAQARPVLEDPVVQYQAQRGLDLLYNVRFSEAARLFDQIDRRYPQHPIGPFLKALNTWWTILLDLADTSHDGAFLASMDEVIRRSDRMLARNADDFDAIFFKGAALGFRGRLYSNRGEWMKAASDGRRAMRYVLAVARKDPANADYAFGRGIYDYYAAAVPERHPYVKPVMVFFPRGNRQRGIDALERTANQGRFIRTEAAYFLLQIYYLYEQNYDRSVYYAQRLRRDHPNNPFFHLFEGRVYARFGHWTAMDGVFTEVLRRAGRKAPGYGPAAAEQAHYYLARGRMVVGRYDEALAHLAALDRLTAARGRDTYFGVWGRLRAGMAYDALGRRAEAVARYREVLRMKDRGGVHARARAYLKRPYAHPYATAAD